MDHVKAILKNSRSQRALAAVVLILALGLMFALHTRDMEDTKDRAMFAVSSTGWKVSELILESLRLETDLRGHATSQISRNSVKLRFDILWSRVDIAENTEIVKNDKIAANLQSYRQFLEDVDPIIFGDRPLLSQEAFARADQVRDLANALRLNWIQIFAGKQFGDVTLELVEREAGMKRQTLIALMLALVAIYLVTEIFRAGVAQKKEARLEAEVTAAALASAAKSRFLANVSHEIRTPLNGILGMTSELGETPLDEDQLGCLKVISHAGDVLLHTLNDVLDLSKVESGQIDLESIVFDLHELTDSAAALYRARIEEKGLTLNFFRNAAVPRFVRGDGRRISQVLHNLIGNAAKFTDKGEIHVLVGLAPEGGYFRFCVVDTGMGVAPEAHKKIFEPFSQADSSITRKKGGTGLGLSISHHLCEAMGGHLEMKSQLGKGATFWFDLPLTEEAPESAEGQQDQAIQTAMAAQAARQRTRSVLIVDDNSTNRLLLRRFLKNQDVELFEANDGAQAVKAATGKAFDVILMDVQMPVMDGIEASQVIRALEKANGRPPAMIIAVTANVMLHQVQEYRASGVDDVLGKPVSKVDLLAMMAADERSAA